MSLEKSINSGKEHRKQYRGNKRYDGACRNHGSCSYCKNGRLYQFRKEQQKAIQKEKEG